MDPLVFLCERDGFFTRETAKDLGYGDRVIAAMVRAGAWHRFRRGYYCLTHVWAALGPEAQHLVRSRAVLHSVGDDVALSHVSGLIAHGINVWGTSLDRVHVTRLDGDSSRIEGDVVHHRGRCLASDLQTVDGLKVLSPARCAVEYASTATGESGLVAFDSALHLGRCTSEQLVERFEELTAWPGMRRVHVPIRMASDKSESVGESRGYWLFWSAGLAAPQRQFQVHDSEGVLRGTCDWGWPRQRVLGEFDGRVKYGRLLKEGQDAGDVVFAEKRREDELREISGCTMIRLVWADLDRPRLTVSRVAKALHWAG